MKEGNAADGEPVEPNGQNGAELNQSDGEKNEQAE
jgi:hypothetical protein